MRLHITNGESVAGTLRWMFAADVVISWDDVLHEGPVPPSATLEDLSAVRARFIASCGWESEESARACFAARDATLRRRNEFDEVTLWFEHDLYDRLQLAQILDFFSRQGISSPLFTIDAADYLGPMPPERLWDLFHHRVPAGDARLLDGRLLWGRFTSSDPRPLASDAPPWLLRFCEEYPWTSDGCTRTERQILQAAAAGVSDAFEMFRWSNAREDAVFMGDTVFFRYLDGLKSCRQPLLDAGNRLTEKGCAVLAGMDDRIRGNGIDLWRGGVHLSGDDSPWRWDPIPARFSHRRT